MRVHILVLAPCLLIGCQTEFSLNPTGDVTLSPHATGDELSIMPRVIIGQTEYTEATVRSNVPDTLLFRPFVNACGGRYTDSLKAALAAWMEFTTELKGGNRQEMKKCLEATGELRAGVRSLPFVAERARYQGMEAWLFQFAWGSATEELGHYRCYVMSATTADTLLFITCR